MPAKNYFLFQLSCNNRTGTILILGYGSRRIKMEKMQWRFHLLNDNTLLKSSVICYIFIQCSVTPFGINTMKLSNCFEISYLQLEIHGSYTEKCQEISELVAHIQYIFCMLSWSIRWIYFLRNLLGVLYKKILYETKCLKL